MFVLNFYKHHLPAGWTANSSIFGWHMEFANADAIRFLPYQHDGASCGFLPDSNEASRDMRNVREGRYPAFGPLHFFTAASTSCPLTCGI